jgi:hypothetical protein
MIRHCFLLGMFALAIAIPAAFATRAAAQRQQSQQPSIQQSSTQQASTQQPSTQPAWTQVGSLMCKLDPSVGFIIAGHQPMQCTYTPSLATVPPQYYDGAINTIGADIGGNTGSVLGWGVFAPTAGVPPGALAAEYVGVSGDVGFGIAGGANVLAGGTGRTYALQPLSVQGSSAVSAVLGVSSLKLRRATWR